MYSFRYKKVVFLYIPVNFCLDAVPPTFLNFISFPLQITRNFRQHCNCSKTLNKTIRCHLYWSILGWVQTIVKGEDVRTEQETREFRLRGLGDISKALPFHAAMDEKVVNLCSFTTVSSFQLQNISFVMRIYIFKRN